MRIVARPIYRGPAVWIVLRTPQNRATQFVSALATLAAARRVATTEKGEFPRDYVYVAKLTHQAQVEGS